MPDFFDTILPAFSEDNPGQNRTATTTALDIARSVFGINQIRGINSKGSTGAGIPKHVTNVSVSISPSAKGSTSKAVVTFHRDPTDKNYSACQIWVKGYQGNSNPVQVATSSESPATFVVNNTGEPLSVVAQAIGNSGEAPLASAPTAGASVAKSTTGGYGTSTVTAYSVSNPPPVTTPAASYMLGPGILNLNQTPPVALSIFASTALTVSVARFFLAADIAGLTHLDGSFTSASGGGKNFAVGFYSTSGVKLWDSGPLHVPNVSNTAISFTIPSLTLPGNTDYYFAWTGDAINDPSTWVVRPGNILLAYNSGSSGNVINQGPVMLGTSPNAAAAGPVLPAGLGTLVAASANVDIPAVLFR